MNHFAHIRWRLVGVNLVVLSLVLVMTLGAALLSEARSRSEVTERELRLAAEREVAIFSREREGDDDAPATLASGSDLFAFAVDRRGTLVRNTRQLALPGLPDMPGLQRALTGQEVWADLESGGVPVRLVSIPVHHDGRIEGAVQVGKPLEAVQREFTRLLTILLLTGGAGLALSAAGSLFLADRAMGPIREAFDRQRQFLADASHELRTPVAVLRARADVLQREGAALPPAQLEQVQLLRSDAEELSTLLDELLDLARLDAGQVQLSLEPVALADVAEEVVAQLEPLAAQRRIKLRAIITQAVWGRSNLTRLRQVLRALADNALKHTPPEGSVRLEVARQGNWAQITIADTGGGIAPEHLPRVMERFYRADAARAHVSGTGGSGAGLGLAIAAELVDRMHGQLRLESGPGRGTTATVLLPLVDRRSQAWRYPGRDPSNDRANEGSDAGRETHR